MCSILDHEINTWQKQRLTKAIPIIKRVIRGRPTVQYHIQKNRGDYLWQGNADNSNWYKGKYIKYLYNNQYKHPFWMQK